MSVAGGISIPITVDLESGLQVKLSIHQPINSTPHLRRCNPSFAGGGTDNEMEPLEHLRSRELRKTTRKPAFMQQSGNGKRVNSKGELSCLICGAEDHWKDEYPHNSSNKIKVKGVSGMQQGEDNGKDIDGELWVSGGVNFIQTTDEGSDAKAKVYFESCTAVITIEKRHLTDLHDSQNTPSNAGKMMMFQRGKLGDLPS